MLMDVIHNIILIVITLALVGLVKYVVDEVREYVEANVENERVKNGINKALDIVTLAVNTTNQTFVKELKDAGSFGGQEAEEAYNATKVAVLEMLDEETKKILEQEFANTDKFLNQAIESKVWESKK